MSQSKLNETKAKGNEKSFDMVFDKEENVLLNLVLLNPFLLSRLFQRGKVQTKAETIERTLRW